MAESTLRSTLLHTAAVLAALAALAALSGGALRAAARERALAALAGVLPAAWYDNDPLQDVLHLQDAAFGSEATVRVLRARRGGAVSAFVVDGAVAQGYAGPVVLRLGITREGELLGVRVLQHAETRGIGDGFASDGGRWLQAFAGRSLQQPPAAAWRLRRDGGAFDQFSGATVTPRAILARVAAVLSAQAEQGDRWAAAEAAP